MDIPPAVIENLGFHLLAAKYFMIASFVMLVYDIVITTDLEIERIWSRKFTGASWLYLMNRYLPPLEYILVIAAFQVPALSEDVLCGRIVRFAGASTQITVAIIGLIMMLRTYALYGRNSYVLGGLAALWLAEQGIMAYALTHSIRVPLPPGFVGCILTAETHYELLTSFFWICPVIFETTVFALTLGRTIVLARRQVRLPLLTLILRDGIGYFAVIVAVNIANILLFLTAPADLQAINASFSQLLPSLLMSRLVLNLKDEEAGKPKVTQRSVYATGIKSEQESHSFFTAAIGILGGHVGSNGPEPSARSYELQSPPAGGNYKSFMPSMPNSRVPMPYADSWAPPSPSLKVPLTGDRRV